MRCEHNDMSGPSRGCSVIGNIPQLTTMWCKIQAQRVTLTQHHGRQPVPRHDSVTSSGVPQTLLIHSHTLSSQGSGSRSELLLTAVQAQR